MVRGPEGGGPTPAEVERTPTPSILDLPSPEPEVRPSNQVEDPAKQQEAEDLSRERESKNQERADDQALERLKTLESALEIGPRNPQEMIEVINAHSFEDLQKREQERKHGKGFVGNMKAWWRGDKDYFFDSDGKLQANNTAQVTRRVASSVLNRRTVASVAAVGALGAITGGVGWVSALVPALGSLGRLTGEMIDHFKGDDIVTGGTRGARREVMLAEKERYYELQQLSADYQRARDSEDMAEANKILHQINAIYYRQGEAGVMAKVARAERNLAEKEEKLEKLRGRLQTVGEVTGIGVGLAASFLSGSFGKLELDWLHKNGASTFHEVITKNGQFHFLWTQADKLAGLGHGAASHVLTTKAGEAAWSMTNVIVASIVERGLPVVGASLLAGLTNRFSRAAEQRNASAMSARQGQEYNALREQIPTMRQYVEGVALENGVFVPDSPSNFVYNWAKQPQVLEKTFELNQLPMWQSVLRDPDQGTLTQVDREGRVVKVGIAAVNADRNLIAIVESIDNIARSGATTFPVKVMRLDDFLRNYQPIIRDIEGRAHSVSAPSIENSGSGPIEPRIISPEDSTNPDHAPEVEEDNNDNSPPNDPKKPKPPPTKKVDTQSIEDDFIAGFEGKKKRHDETNKERTRKGNERVKNIKDGTWPSNFDFFYRQIEQDKNSPDLKERQATLYDGIIFQNLGEEFHQIWQELTPDERKETGVSFSGHSMENGPSQYFSFINIKNPDGSELTLRFGQTEGGIFTSIGKRDGGGKTEFRSKVGVGEVINILREVKQQLNIPEIEEGASATTDSENGSGRSNKKDKKKVETDDPSQKRDKRKQRGNDDVLDAEFTELEPTEEDIENIERPPSLEAVPLSQEVIDGNKHIILNNEGYVAENIAGSSTKQRIELEYTNADLGQGYIMLRTDQGRRRVKFDQIANQIIGFRNDEQGPLQPIKLVEAEQSQAYTEGEAVPDAVPALEVRNEQVVEAAPVIDPKDLDTENAAELLKGRGVTIDDPISFISQSQGQIDGDLSPEELGSNTQFNVSDIGGGLIELRLNGAKLTTTIDEILPHIKQVI